MSYREVSEILREGACISLRRKQNHHKRQKRTSLQGKLLRAVFSKPFLSRCIHSTRV